MLVEGLPGDLALNQIQVIGTHNSFHIAPPPDEMEKLAAIKLKETTEADNDKTLNMEEEEEGKKSEQEGEHRVQALETSLSQKLKLTAGNFQRGDIAYSVTGPLGDIVSARLSAIYSHSDGYFDNLVSGQDKANKNLTLIRPSVRFDFSDSFDVTLKGEYQQNKGGPATSQNIVNPVFPKLAQTLFGYIPPDVKYDINHDLQGY